MCIRDSTNDCPADYDNACHNFRADGGPSYDGSRNEHHGAPDIDIDNFDLDDSDHDHDRRDYSRGHGSPND